MGLDDSMLDSAIDKALDQHEAAAETVDTPAISDEQQTDIAIKEATEKPAARQRDTSGKFSRKAAKTEEADEPSDQVTDQTAEVEENEAHAEGQATAEAPIEIPTFWPAELKALAAEAKDTNLVKGFVDLYQQQEEWGRRNAVEAEKAKAYEKRFYEDFESPQAAETHKAQLRMNGINDPIAELHRYRDWDRVFKSDARQGISDLMRKNGLTPYDFTEEAEENQSQYQDPRIEDAIAKAEAAEQRLKDFEAKQEQAVLYNMVETFKSGKDSAGVERRRYAELYAPQIDKAFNEILQGHPHLSHMEALNHAYEYVKSEAEKAHTGIKAPAPQKTREQLIAESKKAQAASTSMSGAPTTVTASQKPRLKGKNENERLDNALEMAIDRALSAH